MTSLFGKIVIATGAAMLVLGVAPVSAAPVTGTLSGTVTSNGSPLKGVSIAVRDPNGSFDLPLATTAVDGTYSLPNVPIGRYIVTFMLAGYALPSPGFATTTIASGATTTLDESLVAGSSISGKVTDSAGHPVTSGQVVALDATALKALTQYTLVNGSLDPILIGLLPTVIPASISDGWADSPGFAQIKNDGTYTVSGLHASDYYINASSGSMFGPSQVLVTVPAVGQTVTHDIAFPSGATITGHVLTSSGSPMSGVIVTINGGTNSSASLLGGSALSTAPWASTDNNGVYAITGAPKGVFAATASLDGVADFDLQAGNVVHATDTVTVDFAAPGTKTVSGTVLDENQLPVAGATVTLDGMNGSASTHTDVNGKYQVIDLAADSYDVTVDAQGFIPSDVFTADVSSAPSTTTNATIAHGASISGVVSTDQGAPLFGAEVTGTGAASSASAFNSDISLADGSYSLTGLDTGTYAITVESRGFAAPQTVSITVGSRSDAITHNFDMLPVSAALAPGAPEVMTLANHETVSVGVVNQASDGGNPVTTYDIIVTPGNHKCASYTSFSCKVPGLLDGVLYTAKARASNEVHTGPYGVSQFWTDAVPAVTSPVASKGKSGQAIVTFKAPKTPNKIVTYKLEYKVGSSWKVFAHKPSKATKIVVTGLKHKHAYSARITTVCALGRALTSKTFTIKAG